MLQLYSSPSELKTIIQKAGFTQDFKPVMTFKRQQRIKYPFTFSLEEPTAKQLSKASRELTTNLKLRKKINTLSTADFALNQPNRKKSKSQPLAVCADLNAKTTLNARINVRKILLLLLYKRGNDAWKWCMACSQSQAWTHKLAHMHKTIQTSRERAVTNRSKVDKDSVSQLFIVFLGAKEKEQKQSVRITERNK